MYSVLIFALSSSFSIVLFFQFAFVFFQKGAKHKGPKPKHHLRTEKGGGTKGFFKAYGPEIKAFVKKRGRKPKQLCTSWALHRRAESMTTHRYHFLIPCLYILDEITFFYAMNLFCAPLLFLRLQILNLNNTVFYLSFFLSFFPYIYLLSLSVFICILNMRNNKGIVCFQNLIYQAQISSMSRNFFFAENRELYICIFKEAE